MKSPIAVAVAILSGLVVLFGYFIPYPRFEGLEIRGILLEWAVILAGVAMLVGITNLVSVHWHKLFAERERDYYSALLLIAFFVTLIAGLWVSPADASFQQVVLSIQAPVEASLLAMLAVVLAFASLRLLKRRKTLMSLVFAGSALLFLLYGSGLLAGLGNIPALKIILSVIGRLPLAGSRGILLGMALGSLTAGLRLLLGADRPYSG